jgi:monofunctional chorismate mutase
MIQKGIRGAVSVEENTEESIITNTKLLLNKILDENSFKMEDVVSVIFSATRDLTKIYPAKVARDTGFSNVPLICLQEMYVEYSLEKCIRVLITINCGKDTEIKHVYLKKAAKLRPDITE